MEAYGHRWEVRFLRMLLGEPFERGSLQGCRPYLQMQDSEPKKVQERFKYTYHLEKQLDQRLQGKSVFGT